MTVVDPDRDWLNDPASCACGEEDCELAFFGYFLCVCGEHHRPPVATEGRCPVDVNGEVIDQAEWTENCTGYVLDTGQIRALRCLAANRPLTTI